MTTSIEWRHHLHLEIIKYYRETVRLENMLDGKQFQKTYKNRHCPSAKALSEDRREAIRCLVEARKWLFKSYDRLPEVQQTGELQGEQQAFTYAKQLCKSKRKPRFMKNQRIMKQAQSQVAK